MKRIWNGVVRGSLIGLMLVSFAVAGTALAQEPKRAITKIAGDLYRFQNNFHYSVFLVTAEGVIATDPIDAAAASWLKAEIAKRFGKEIKYLIYSHDHRDHSAGGEVFAETATVIAHANAAAAIIGEKRPTAVPDLTFTDKMVLSLGGKTVELIYLGRSHSDNMIVMRFPAEGVVFAVDFVAVNRLPFNTLSDAYFPEWIDALKRLEALDFKILATGHGPNGGKGDVTAHRRYLEELYASVLKAARAGQSLEEMQQSITMEAYKEWSQYKAWRPLNIEGMYGQVNLHRRGN